jgi:hypothetical protein
MSKKNIIDSIEVKNNCLEDWKEMRGGKKVRLCSHCDFNVNNLSAMTRKQAMRLVRESNGRLCVRYIKNPLNNQPVFADKFYQIGRRAPRLAIGAMTAALSFSSMAYAQGDISTTIKDKPQIETTDKKPSDETKTAPVANEEKPAEISIKTIDIPTYMMGIMVAIEHRSALHQAVSNDDLEEVRNLISNGENINLKDENYSNITPLFLAVENGNAEIVETLLGFGAKAHARDANRQTPLMRLDEDASPELVRLLMQYGARINSFDSDGNTALIFAARSVKPEVLEILVRNGAKINAQNKQGLTALMQAAEADNLENVKALLAAGADVNLRNKDGETAYDLTDADEIEKLLVNYGAEVKENPKQDETENK